MLRDRQRAVDCVIAAALLLSPFVLYRQVLDLFWLYDTPFHLRLLAEYTPADFFFSRRPWREEKDVFTPLFYLSLWLDRGGSPRIFYFHQLGAIGACAASLYAVSRLWLARAPAAAGAALFLLGPAVAASAPILMVRHYFEALALSILAVGAFALGMRRRSAGWTAASAALYLAAMLEKETAVPVAALFVIVPEGRWQERCSRAAGPAAALAAYVLYRIAMLERPLSSHGWLDPGGIGHLAATFPRKLLAALGGEHVGLALALTLALGLAVAALSRPAAAAILAACALILAAVLPVSFEPEARYFLTAWAGLAAAAAGGWARAAHHPRLAWFVPIGVGATLGIAAAAGRAAWSSELGVASRMSVEGRTYAALAPSSALAYPALSTATLRELALLRPGGAAASAAWFQDPLFLCLRRDRGLQIWSFDAANGKVEEMSSEVRREGRRRCKAIRRHAPLRAAFHWRPEGLFWELGPYPDPGYSLVTDDGVSRIVVPARGGYRWTYGDLVLRVRYESPAGWATYSPPLSLGPAQAELAWSR
jgi:hypothetical protein